MAYIVGYVTKEQKEILTQRGWEVEDAKDYNLCGDSRSHLLAGPHSPDEAIVVFVDSSIFDIMSGPDWEK